MFPEMTLSAQQKGKGRLVSQESAKRAGFSSSPSKSSMSSSSSSSHSSSGSESDEDSSEDEEEEEEDDVSQEYLDSLLEKARRSIASKAIGKTVADKGDVLEEDIIGLDDPESELKCVPPTPFLPFFSLSFPLARFLPYSRSLPALDPGTLPNSYITLGKTLNDAPLAVRDLDAERVMESSLSLSTPAPPPPPPELTKSGKPLTKKEKKTVGRFQVILSMHGRTNTLVS